MIPLITGFSASGSLIVAIGAQNAFVIRQGLLRQHLFLTALLCSLIDSLLIILGVVGFGQVVSNFPWFIDFTKYFAILFLFSYGLLSFKYACREENTNQAFDGGAIFTAKKTVFTLLAFSLLNPHVYLDTVILLGSIASQQPPEEQMFFALGAIAASFTWFFGITYGAQILAPFFQKKNAWRIIDFVIGLTMWIISVLLILHF